MDVGEVASGERRARRAAAEQEQLQSSGVEGKETFYTASKIFLQTIQHLGGQRQDHAQVLLSKSRGVLTSTYYGGWKP